MAFVFGPLELANSNDSTDDQALFHLMAECKNKLEAYGQAEAAESPAPESYFRQRPAVVVRTTTDGMYNEQLRQPGPHTRSYAPKKYIDQTFTTVRR